MSDKSVHMLCVTAVVVAAIAAVVVLALFYHGDVAALVSGVVAVGLFAWGKIDMRQIATDNKTSNEIVQKQVQAVAVKADSVSQEVGDKAMAAIEASKEVSDKVGTMVAIMDAMPKDKL